MKKNLLLCSGLVLSISNSPYILAARASRELQGLTEIQTTFTHLYRLQAKFPTAVVECYKNAFVRSYSETNNTPEQSRIDHERALEVRDEWIRYAHLVYSDNIQYDMLSKPVHNFWRTFLQFSTKYRTYLRHFPQSNGYDIHPLLNISASACTQVGESDLPCRWKQKEQFRKAYLARYGSGDDRTISPIWQLGRCHWSNANPCRPKCLAEIKKD